MELPAGAPSTYGTPHPPVLTPVNRPVIHFTQLGLSVFGFELVLLSGLARTGLIVAGRGNTSGSFNAS